MSQPIFDNPYDVLELAPTASTVEITKAFTVATKKRQYPVDVIAKARKALMNPQERLIADFLRPCLPPVERLKRTDYSALDQPTAPLQFRDDLFDTLNTIADAKPAGRLDQQLGLQMFSSSPLATIQLAEFSIDPPLRLRLPPKPVQGASKNSQPSFVPVAAFDPIEAKPSFVVEKLPTTAGILQNLMRALTDHKKLSSQMIVASFALPFGYVIATQIFQPMQQLIQPKQTENTNIEVSTTKIEQASKELQPANTSHKKSYTQPSSQMAEPNQGSSKVNNPFTSGSLKPNSTRLPYTGRSRIFTHKQPEISGTISSSNDSSTDLPLKVFDLQGRNSCGDQSNSSRDWYPVYIPNTPENLQEIRQFCRDAIPRYRVDRDRISIQVASFTSRTNAANFARQLGTKFNSVEIGDPDSRTANQPVAEKQCGDSQASSSEGRWFPVLIDYSERNLNLVRSRYCADAFLKRSENGRTFRIQVASFSSYQSAANFAAQLKRTFNSANVGASSKSQ